MITFACHVLTISVAKLSFQEMSKSAQVEGWDESGSWNDTRFAHPPGTPIPSPFGGGDYEKTLFIRKFRFTCVWKVLRIRRDNIWINVRQKRKFLNNDESR